MLSKRSVLFLFCLCINYHARFQYNIKYSIAGLRKKQNHVWCVCRAQHSRRHGGQSTIALDRNVRILLYTLGVYTFTYISAERWSVVHNCNSSEGKKRTQREYYTWTRREEYSGKILIYELGQKFHSRNTSRYIRNIIYCYHSGAYTILLF